MTLAGDPSVGEVFEAQLERSAAALVAIARRLERDRPLGGGEDEFLAWFARVSDCAPAVFSRVWSDPQAYAWAKRAYEALADVVRGGAEDARGELSEALHAFAPFALACAHLDGRDLTLRRPFRFRGRLALPGTRFTLESDGPAELRGVSSREIFVARAGAAGEGEPIALAPESPGAAAGVSLAACPVLERKGVAIRLQPAVFRDRIEETWPEDADPEIQRRHVGVLAGALDLVDRFHADAARLSERLRVVAFKPPGASLVGNTSSSELPGALALTAGDDLWMLSESLVHELHHQRLFALEMEGALFSDPDQDGGRDLRHYSPWRDEPRPMKGLLHAVYVFVEVARHWLAVLETSRPDESAGRWRARERLRFLSLQLPLARDTVRADARFSAPGRALFDGIEQRLDDALARMTAAGIEPDAQTRRRFEAHRDRYDTRHALARLGPSLGLEARGPLPAGAGADAATAGRVSCLCVTRGRVARLAGALACFRAQTWPDRELVIVYEDDDPETAAFAEDAARGSPDVVAVRTPGHPRATLGELRNRAVAHATGAWVCQWDDDDWHHPERIAAQIASVAAEPGAVAGVLSRWIVFDEASGRAHLSLHRTWEGSLLCRRDALPAYPALPRGEDSPVVYALEDSGGLVTLERPELYVYVVHGTNTWPRSHFVPYVESAFDLGDARSAEVAEQLAQASGRASGAAP